MGIPKLQENSIQNLVHTGIIGYLKVYEFVVDAPPYFIVTFLKIASDIKLVFHSSTITMMHGPINVRFYKWLSVFASTH